VLDHGGDDAVTDLDDVKAGKYELVAVSWDEIKSKPGEPLDFVRHRRGDIVDLDVETARRLVRSGAVVKPGARQQAQAQAALANLRAALEQLTPEQREQLLATGAAIETPTAPKKRAAKKAAAKGADQPPPAVTPAPSGTPAPQGDSTPPDDGDDQGDGGDDGSGS
jgi:hypothetical protein